CNGEFVPQTLILLVRNIIGLKSTFEPGYGVIWLAVLQEAVSQQIATLEKLTRSIARSHQADRVLKLPDRLFDQTHALICDPGVIMGFVIAMVTRFSFVKAEFRSHLFYAERAHDSLQV